MPEDAAPVVQVKNLGQVAYRAALELQTELVASRRGETIPDQLLLLEHPHVLTLGSSSRGEHVLLSKQQLKERGLEVFEAGRGGDVTYHGPGQLVGYPILQLEPGRRDLHRYLRDLEDVLIRSVGSFGIPAWREEGLTGIWTSSGKLAAIGIRVSSGWITSHGFALNVDPDLSFYSSIVPCGIPDRPVASMAGILGRPVSIQDVTPTLIQAFGEVFSRTPIVG
jgi:lipoate-protein ligase B